MSRCEARVAGRGLLLPDRQCEEAAAVLLTAPELTDRARRRLTPNGAASLDQHGYVGLCRDHRDQLRDT